uniref:Insulin-like domain-containing protein n=1 Tax=Caenorhabditis japonica TaxID=281687 RepID=A0A8R1ET55_CAEJA
MLKMIPFALIILYLSTVHCQTEIPDLIKKKLILAEVIGNFTDTQGAQFSRNVHSPNHRNFYCWKRAQEKIKSICPDGCSSVQDFLIDTMCNQSVSNADVEDFCCPPESSGAKLNDK